MIDALNFNNIGYAYDTVLEEYTGRKMHESLQKVLKESNCKNTEYRERERALHADYKLEIPK